MARCDAPLQRPAAAKACSGKCTGGACHAAPHLWVMAACDGMISLFEKQDDGHLALLPQDGSMVAPSIDRFLDYMDQAVKTGKLSQLVVVGTSNDIAWTHVFLPDAIAKYLVAEIQYPLVPAWFRQPSDLGRLAHALEHVLLA